MLASISGLFWSRCHSIVSEFPRVVPGRNPAKVQRETTFSRLIGSFDLLHSSSTREQDEGRGTRPPTQRELHSTGACTRGFGFSGVLDLMNSRYCTSLGSFKGSQVRGRTATVSMAHCRSHWGMGFGNTGKRWNVDSLRNVVARRHHNMFMYAPFGNNGGYPKRERRTHMLASDGGGGGSGDGGSNKGTGGDGSDDEENDEFLDLTQAEELAAAKGVELPQDYAAIAAQGGIRASILTQYCAIASGGLFTGFLSRSIPAFRDRLIADRLYFFKLLVEVVIDSGCATVAEVRKRGEEFWDEFEFYLSDMLVGLVMDVVLVSLLAPVAVAGRKRKVPKTGLRRWSSQLPSAVFEKSVDKKYTFSDRVGCYVARGLEYSLAGIVCGFVGQGIASGLMTAKRQYMGSKEGDVEVPPVFESALVWGAFMGLSANTRYQVVFGLERVVDETIARRIPQVAYLTTLAIRFVNNIIGGEQFIDMARWAGVQ